MRRYPWVKGRQKYVVASWVGIPFGHTESVRFLEPVAVQDGPAGLVGESTLVRFSQLSLVSTLPAGNVMARFQIRHMSRRLET